MNSTEIAIQSITNVSFMIILGCICLTLLEACRLLVREGGSKSKTKVTVPSDTRAIVYSILLITMKIVLITSIYYVYQFLILAYTIVVGG